MNFQMLLWFAILGFLCRNSSWHTWSLLPLLLMRIQRLLREAYSDLHRAACGIGQLNVAIESGLVGKGLIDVMLYIEERS